MNRLFFTIALLACSLSASAQDWASVFSKYNTMKGVESVYISPEMFKMTGKLPKVEILDKDINLTPGVISLKGLYVLESGNTKTSKKILADTRLYIKNANMQKIMNEKFEGEQSEIFATMDKKTVSNVIFITIEKDKDIEVTAIEGEMSTDSFNKLIKKVRKK